MSGRSPTFGSTLDAELRRDLASVIESVPVDDGGGSSPVKILLLAELIVAEGLSRVVEIGVYRGRLMLPLARLMVRLGRGEVVGIDPYSPGAAVQRDVEREGIDLTFWPQTVDWDGIHREVEEAISHWGLDERTRLLRERSEDAARSFSNSSIDLLHVDGNHDREAVTRDLDLFMPHVRGGGFIVMDDIAWPSVRPVYEAVASRYEVVFSLVETGLSLWPPGGPNDFAVLRVGSSPGDGE